MIGRPAATLLHLGPGLANGLANLHNARRAGTPVVNLVGDHATWHLGVDAPLTSDIAGLAAPVSRWVRTAASAAGLAGDGADAVAAARLGGVATLIAPADCQWGDGAEPAPAPAPAVLPRLPYVPELATAELSGAATVVLVGARSPVSFFGYPGLPSSTVPAGTAVVTLAEPGAAVTEALARLAERVGPAPQ